MRKLYFENASGERIDLNRKNHILASELKGFGISCSPTFTDLGQGFFSEEDTDKHPQQTRGFKLNFVSDNPYQDYRELLAWLSSNAVHLVYVPYGSEEYSCDISVAEIQKGELNAVGWLVCDAEFYCKTPWYRKDTVSVDMTASYGDTLRFSYVYTSDLRFGSDVAAEFQAELYGGGQQPAAFILRYIGAIVDPVIRLADARTGETVGLCMLNRSLLASDTLELCTIPNDNYIRLLSADGTATDLIDRIDPTENPFPLVPPGMVCNFAITSGAPITGTATVDIYYFYRSV